MPLTAIGIKKAADGHLADGRGLRLEKKGDGGKKALRGGGCRHFRRTCFQN